ncbi:hypothetical protein [Phytomonospora endophytica]|uniref:Uncharacterized protein n=1 Tax=Phytomonospora endophytica TaxID=714109 RepID=A0A841FD12_9ACTN|nr:hypothetical protein [Phytomonospora endophytica]MBB6033694.1 hypothetical protein [Phytomonospora endophytica]GIG64789.1 hypothetical protein Pen01_10840 [Phytomonospora endophytica]
MNTALPDLAGFVLNKVVENIDFEGVAVPGLDGWFYRKEEEDGRTASVGVYTFDDREVFRAWGYVGESHCRASALHLPGGGWEGPHHDCPEVRVHRRGQIVIGFSVRVGEAEPRYLLINGSDGGEPGPARYAHAGV